MKSTAKPTFTLPKIGASYRVAFSPDGSLLATLSKKVSVWDMMTGTRLFNERPLSWCSRITWSPDGKQLAVTNTRAHSVVLDPRSGDVLHDLKNAAAPGEDGADPVFSACGKYLVSGNGDGVLLVYEVKTGKRTFSEDYPGDMICSVAPLKDGREWLVLHLSRDSKPPGYLTRHSWPFRPDEGKRIDLPFNRSPYHFGLSPDGKLAAFQVPVLGENFKLLSLPAAKIVHSQKVEFQINARFKWSADGAWLATIQRDAVVFYRSDNFNKVIKYPLEEPNDVALSPRGDCVAFAAGAKASRVVPWKDVFGEE